MVACVVGALMGDAWMVLPALVALCRTREVRLVSGSYALPVWEWGIRHAAGADYTIEQVIQDPDHEEEPFCPGKGWLSLDLALEFVRAEYPGEVVVGCAEIGSAYLWDPPMLELRALVVGDGPAVVVHPYTRHEWKNCDGAIGRLSFRRPVKVVGLAGEFVKAGWESIQGFDAMVQAVIEAAGFVGVLSSFTQLAAMFGKKQVVVSFTEDIPMANPRAVKLVCPGAAQLQAACDEMGL